jgi:uncharacterized repeat protein (TIGR01451 family)
MKTLCAMLIFVFCTFSVHAQTAAQSCATPGLDGVSYSAPSYYPATASAGINATVISIGTIRSTAGTGGAPGTTPLRVGDLIMIIQMQDATFNSTDSVSFGNGSTGRGYTALNNTGKFEFKRVTAVSATSVNIDSGLTYAYTNAAPSASGATSNGQRRFQVIRVPQFASVTLPGGTIRPPSWDGQTGGVWVIDVAGNLNMNGTTVDASALGFRGGAALPNYYDNTGTRVNYATPIVDSTQVGEGCQAGGAGNLNLGAVKGEGISGTPRFVRNQSPSGSNSLVAFPRTDLTSSGYPGGLDLARGAPGNAGGGGTQHNAGGGGGSNIGQGGIGGNTFAFYFATNQGTCVQFAPNFFGCTGDGARAMGGLGGGTVTASIENIIMGGGGGAGDNNNACDNPTVNQAAGGNGGGLIFIRAGTISNSGTLLANGQNGLPGGRDAAGGGGAGGTVVVLSTTATPGLTIQTVGGQGGNTGYSGTGGTAGTFLYAGETQGPGAGGGGGAIIRSSNITGFTSSNLSGGLGGRVFPVNGNVTINNAYGTGSGGGLAATVPFTAAAQTLGSQCLPNVTASKRTTTPLVVFPQINTAQYVITLSNAGPGAAVGTTLVDTLQNPFQYNAATAPLNEVGLVYTGGAAGPVSPTTGAGTQTFRVGNSGSNSTTDSFYLAPNSTVSFTVTVQVNGAGVTPTFGNVYQNTVTLSFLDPFRTGATTTVSPGSAYTGTTTAALGSNYAANSSTQENVTVLAAVNVTITKTNGITSPTALIAGQTINYTVTVANIGGTASVDLVNGVLRDPAAPGLACTAVSCVVPAGSTSQCPAPAAVTLANLQGAGITIPLLRTGTVGPPPPNRLEFIVTCGVTATGQ